MFEQFLAGGVLVLLTTIVHGGCTTFTLLILKWTRSGRLTLTTSVARTLLISYVVLMMFLASLLEAGLWATVYLLVGAIEGAEKAMYFSLVTYTTLGYGDITLGEQWRLLAAIQAGNGIIMFGWSTALVYAAVQHSVAHNQNTSRETGTP